MGAMIADWQSAIENRQCRNPSATADGTDLIATARPFIQTVLTENNSKLSGTDAKKSRAVDIIGVPLAYGASMAGVELGPAALRVARLKRRIAQLDYVVRDLGDIEVEQSQANPEPGSKLHYLKEISDACIELAQKVEGVLAAGE